MGCPIDDRRHATATAARRTALARALRAVCLLLGCGLFVLPSARALQLHGVQIPTQQVVGTQTLQCNGAGTRWILFFKIYVAGLYLPRPARSASQALAMAGPKQMRLVMLRDVSGKELVQHMESDLKANLSSRQLAPFKPALERLRSAFMARHDLPSGAVIDMRELPAGGLEVLINGEPLGAPLRQAGLFDAVLRAWLGSNPADARLKRALLGDTSASG